MCVYTSVTIIRQSVCLCVGLSCLSVPVRLCQSFCLFLSASAGLSIGSPLQVSLIRLDTRKAELADLPLWLSPRARLRVQLLPAQFVICIHVSLQRHSIHRR